MHRRCSDSSSLRDTSNLLGINKQDGAQSQCCGKEVACDQDDVPTHRKDLYPLEFREILVLDLVPTGLAVPVVK